MDSAYNVAGIDVHKRMVAAVITNARESELHFECRRFGTTVGELRQLGAWLQAHAVQELAMESTAQYWKPVWMALEGQCRLHLAQARSNRGPRGRKTDFRDAQRVVSRLLSGDLILSFVPDAEQRGWRTLTRTKHQLTRDRVRLQSQLESVLKSARSSSPVWSAICWGPVGGGSCAPSPPARRIPPGWPRSATSASAPVRRS